LPDITIDQYRTNTIANTVEGACGHSLLNGAARSAVRCLTLDVCPNG
jgi:uncharacterized metal-binding protein